MPVFRAKDGVLKLPDSSEEWKEDFTFIQAADCQLGMTWSCRGAGGYGAGNGYQDNPNYENSTWSPEIRWCNSFVSMVNNMEIKPKFAIMCGDILDAWPNNGETALRVRDKQYVDFQKIFKELDVPLVCVCGNHDVGNSPTRETVDKYRSDFGDDWFSFVCNGVFCIVINSQYYHDPQFVPEIAAEHNSWLDEQLKIAKSGKYKHSILFQHIPWFLNTPDEPKVYYNFPQPFRENMLKRLSEAGISKIFCGHYHRNAGGWYNDSMELIVTSAIGLQQGTDRNGFRVVSVAERDISHEYVELDNIDE